MLVEGITGKCKQLLCNKSAKIRQPNKLFLLLTVLQSLTAIAVVACLLSFPAQSASAQVASRNANTSAGSAEVRVIDSVKIASILAEDKGGTSSLIRGSLVENSEFDESKLAELKKSGLHIGKGTVGHFLVLEQGNALFCPNNDLVVRTLQSELYLSKGAVVFVMTNGAATSIYNLHVVHVGDLAVVVGKYILKIVPGKQVVLTRLPANDFSAVNPELRIVACNPKHDLMPNGMQLWRADFSILSALANVQPLQVLLASSDYRYQQLVAQVLKTATGKNVSNCTSESFTGGTELPTVR